MKLKIFSVCLIALSPFTVAQNDLDIEEFFEEESETRQAEVSPIVSQSETLADVPADYAPTPFFDVPQQNSEEFDLAKQQRLLEQSNSLAILLRQIKEAGNEDAVLTMLESLVGNPESLAFFNDAFDDIEVRRQTRQPTVQNVAAQVAAAIQGNTTTPPVIRPKEIHPVQPVFAQVFSESGSRTKAMVAIDGNRFTRVPGETISVDGRTILVKSITSERINDRDQYTITVEENGVTQRLLWQ